MDEQRQLIWGGALSVAGLAIIAAAAFFINPSNPKQEQPLMKNDVDATKLQLSSPAFENSRPIPERYSCQGQNISPPLSIKGVPAAAESLAIIMHDPDAPAGDWLHWTIWNIAPQTTQLREGSLPGGTTEGITDFGTIGYGGPCPPSGTHRYFFELYALDSKLDLPDGSRRGELEEAIQKHLLTKAELVGLFTR